ncbi:Fungalysin metallopeptidase-domain-containing protein [Catenaria anguillulae PL171]|uniref:Extracellular metalloproteinase n=1 Tax=Catenaria anguillulae PL171 TaxID=765915 RepID=A0A1Y2HE27_9FUNG|nr:Fungalysin metallopeptidase-domain-containing protein [Catenaria anguillulae PL171]
MTRLLVLLAALSALLALGSSPAAAFRDPTEVDSHPGAAGLSPQQQRERVSSGRIAFGPSGLPHPTFKATPHLARVNQVPHATGRHAFASRFAEGDRGAVITMSDAERIAVDFVAKETKVAPSNLSVLSSLKSEHNGVTHVYIRQVVHGLEVANADANVNLDQFGRVISFGSSLQSGPTPGHANKKSLASSLSSMLFSSQQQHHFSTGSTPTPAVSPHQALASLLTKLERHDSHSSSAATTLDTTLLASFSSHDALSSSNTEQQPRGFIGSYTAVPGISVSDIPVYLAYLHTPTSDAASLSNTSSRPNLSLVYAYEIESPTSWVHAHVCSQTGEVLSVIDWAADSQDAQAESTHRGRRRRRRRNRTSNKDKDKAIPVGSTYRVYPIGVNDPDDGPRVLLTHVASPSNSDSSSSTPASSSTRWVARGSTSGNNVVAEDNPYGSDSVADPTRHYRPHPGKHVKTFDYPIDFSKNPSTYLDAAITQLFYTNNALHDIFYAYGFTEPAGNFQKHNMGRGGAGADAVVAYAQDGSGFSNANFMTPPDGRSGKMRMYVWNTVTPYRDGDLENGIIIHEFGHGVSTRLTGGRLNSGCLGWGEAGGMGEGWGDVWSVMLRMRTSAMAHRSWPHPWEMGKYANGGKVGIRKYPYSPDMDVNPSTYSTMNANGYWGVHAKGEVWAIMLLEVLWSLVDELGFTSDWLSASREHGNTLMMQIIVDALKMQPCRPTFLDARDAMFQASRAFAKRGLGVNAKRIPAKSPWMDETRVDGFHAGRV